MSDRICGAELELQPAYLKALCVVPVELPGPEPGDVFDLLRCVLQAGHTGAHHALARALPMDHPGEIWACWPDGRQPTGLIRAADCPCLDPEDRDVACMLFNGHAGAHSWALADPDEDELRARLGLVPPQASTTADVTTTHPALRKRCSHLQIEKRGGKTHCTRCGRQIYL